MEALAIFLIKGTFAMFGSSLIMFAKINREMEIQIEQMQLEMEDAQLQEVQPKLELKIEPQRK